MGGDLPYRIPIPSQQSLWNQHKTPYITQRSIESLYTKCTKWVRVTNNMASAQPTKMVTKPQDKKLYTTINDYHVKSIGPKEYVSYTRKIQKG